MPYNPTKIVLLGDSTLDNFVWVDHEKDTVRGKLKQKCSDNAEVIDLSCDGFTTSDVLKGAKRNKAVSSRYHQNELYQPLVALKALDNPSHLVLSVGGNDLRENLSFLALMEPAKRKTTLNRIIKDIQQQYFEILKQVKTIHPGVAPILMLQYTPDSTRDVYGIYTLMNLLHSEKALSKFGMLKFLAWGRKNNATQEAVAELHSLMQKVYEPILQYAKEQNIPVIDMASTFDHRDTSFYRQQIEPSAKGAETIATLIDHVVQHHDFSKSSAIYSKPNGDSDTIVTQTNHDSWRPRRHCPGTKLQARSMFFTEYNKHLEQDKQAWCGLYSFFARSNVREDMDFDHLLKHAQGSGKRSQEVMHSLGWLDNDNQLNLKLT